MPANNPDTTATLEITIQSQSFLVPHRYVAGEIVLTEGEAHALQQVYAENLRNNFATQMKKRADEIADAQAKNLDVIPEPLGQADLDAYVAGYNFGIRTSGGIAVNPVEAEEARLAVAAIKVALTQRGQTWKGKTEEEQNAMVEKVVGSGRFRAEAEAIVAAKRAAKAATVGGAALDI